ncbi:MAG: TIGR00341 family protein [Alistipes sp.]|nr:TIGR00341 family protein [Alistipes sp.]
MTQKGKNNDRNDSGLSHGLRAIGHFLREKFDLDQDKARQEEVVENISKGVVFTGPNLWILIFATFIASLGLNVNSTAVVIGAMLISPLMGPIMGIGLSLGINDFELMKRSLRNFGLIVSVSIVASTVYFFISPLSHAQSELLARTSPTLYDVLIAFFGGLAGIVAQSRKDRTTLVIPGVAIATALMPPLCTAGFGIANGQWNFFVGGAYLFFINTVFIALATYIIVRFMKYHKKEFLDKSRERKVKNYMMAIIVLTLVPSIFLSYRIVRKSIFENNAERFVTTVFNFRNTQVLDYKTIYKSHRENSQIDIMLIGEPLAQDVIDNISAQLPVYGLKDTELFIGQSDGNDRIDINTLQQSYSQLLEEKNRKISEMESELGRLSADTLPAYDISLEAGAVVDNIKNISLSRQYVRDGNGNTVDTLVVCFVVREDAAKKIDTERLEQWLGTRTRSRRVRIFVE